MSTSAATAASSSHPHERLRDTWPLHRRQLGRLAAAYVLITGTFVAIGLLITGPLDGSSVQRTDDSVERWFVAHRTPTWNSLSWWGSMLSETSTKVVLTSIVCLWLVVRYRRWFDAALIAVPLVLEAAAFLTTTLIVGRPRPNVPRLDSSPVGSSFPSGHTAAAVCYVAIAVVMARHCSRRWLVWLGCSLVAIVTVAVGLARMYRGMHHLSDVVAGVVLGAVSVLVTIAILDRSPEAEALPDRACP